jgi:ABC-2 type transport system permease protein
VLLAPAAGVLAFLLTRSAGADAGAAWARAGWIAAAYAAYVTTFTAFSVAVSASTRNARSALTVLLSVWALNCIVAPRLASDLVHGTLPTPKLAEFEAEMQKDIQEGLDGHDSRSKAIEEFTKKTLAEYGKSNPNELPFNFQGHVMLESERLAGEVFDHHFGKLWDRIQKQDRAVAACGVFAPMLALRAASMAFAGTDFAHHRRFARAAEDHRREFVRLLNEDLKFNARPGDHRYTAGRELWEKLPVFQFEPPPFEVAWTEARPAIAILFGWLAAAILTLYWSASRLRAMVA